MVKEEFDINSLVNEIDFNSFFIGYQKNDIVLTNKEVSILEQNDIDYKSVFSTTELLYLIDDVINSTDGLFELEDIARDISDRSYYLNTRK